MIFNIIIALIGCITGCTGLIISIYRAFLERGKLTANVNEDHCWYFPKVDEYAASVNQAVVSVLLINRSIYPVTIYKISVQCGKFDYSYNPYPDDSISVPSSTYFLGDSPVTLHINTQSQIDLPYVIPPFGVYDGVLFFPKFLKNHY